MDTLEELQAQLVLVNTTIQKLLAGEKITEFEIGSGSSARRYKYDEVSLETLNTEKTRIASGIASLTDSEPMFRVSSHMQTIYRKI